MLSTVMNDLAGVIGSALRWPEQMVATLCGPPLLDRFDDDQTSVWEPFLTDDR